MIKFNAVILFVLWSSHFFTSTLSDGNRSSRFKRKPYYYASTSDIHGTFPAFDTQISPTKRYIDLSSNSVIRYTPVYQKQPVPTAFNQHFKRILNKIKNFKRKLKNYRRNHLTTPQYAAVPVDPLAITPIAVPAYDYFPVGPDYLNQYLQISHKYDRQSCIYLKISEDSFMKVQCYPILPHTDQVEVYPNTYNEVLSNPDVANVYNTLLPNAPEDSYPHSSLNDIHQLPGTSLGPYETIPYSNTYYHQSTPHQQPQYSVFTPHPIPHHFPIPPTFSPSSVPYTKYSKPPKVIIHANKTTLPLSITFPSKSNGLLSNFTDNKLTTVANTNEPNINRFPVDTKSEMTDNDSPTKISLLNHAIVPLDIEPTEKLDTSKLFYHPDDSAVVVASTEKSSSSTVEPSPTPYELYIIPGLGITNPWDGTEFTQAPTSPSKRTTLSKSGKEDNMTNTIGVTQGISEEDKNVYGSTDNLSETTIRVGIYTEQPVEATTVLVKTSGTEDRVYDPVDLEVTSTIVTHPGVETTTYDNLFVTTVASRYTNIDTDLKQVPEVSIGYHTPITSEEKSLTTEKSDDNEEKIFTAALTERGHVEYTTNSEVTFTESELRIVTSTPFQKENFDYATIPASQSILSSEISREYFGPLITTLLYDRDTPPYTDNTKNEMKQLLSTSVRSFTDEYETSTQDLNQLITGVRDSSATTTVESDDLRQLPSTTIESEFVKTTVEPNNLRNFPSGGVETTTIYSSSDYLKQFPTTTDYSFITTADSTPDDLRLLPSTTVDSFVPTTGEADYLKQLPSSTVDILERTIDELNDFKQSLRSTVDSYVTTTDGSNEFKQLPTSTVDTFETTTDGPNDFRQLPTSTVDTFETTTDGPNDFRQLPTSTVDTFETTDGLHVFKQLPTSTVDTFETTTDGPNDFRQLPTSTVDTFETTDGLNVFKQLPTSTVDTFETTTDGPNDFRQLPTSTVDTFETTDGLNVFKQLPTSTVDTFETTTDGPNDLRQLPTSTVDTFETTTDGPNDLRQLPTSTVDTFETTTNGPNDFIQLPSSTVDTFETTTDGPNDLRQLPTSTVDTFETTTDGPNGFRQLPTGTVYSLETTTVDRSSDDLRQLPSSTVATFETTTDEPNDLRQMPTGTVDSLETTTVDRSSYDVRQLPSSTVATFETTTDAPNDLRQLPTGTDDSLETTTVDRSSDYLRQLPSSTIDSYVTTTDEDNEFRQLSTVTVDSLEITTVNRSSDDLQEFHYGPVDSLVTSTFELEHLRQLLTTIDGTSYDFKHVGDGTTEFFLTSPAYYGNISYDLRELPTTEKDNATTYSDKLLLKEVTTENDVRQLSTANNDNDDIPSSTTDDTMTWFTSDLEDVIPSTTFPSRALVTEENSERHTTQSTTTFKVEEITEYSEQLSATTTHLIESLEKSIEDNEIIPHQGFSGNTEVKGDSFFHNKLPIKVDKSNNLDVNSVVNHNNSSEQDKIKLDKNNILSLSSENMKGNYGRKIPLESDEGNIVKVLEKNSNTGNWEVQYYKVNANNTSLNSEDIDLPRRSDVLISDYDGYDNIDSEAGEQYEYDYRAKNNSTVEDLGKIPGKIYMRSLPNDEATKNTKDVGRKKRQETYNIKELEELSSSYEKMKENNSTVLSDIRNITQNNTENSNKTNINVNYLDDFLKITDQVRKYYEEKKELNRTKRGLESSVNEENNISSLEKKKEKRTTNSLSIGRNKRLNGMNSTQPQRRYKRYVSSMTSITEITDNSVDIIDNNSTSENDITKPTIKHFPVPELLLHNENSSPSNVEQTLINVQANGKDTLVNFLNPPSIKNSKYLNFKKTPNYNELGTRQKKKINAKSFNASLFNIEYKIETTTTAFPQTGFNTQVFGERANKTSIYKHKNLTNVDIHEKSVFPVNISSIPELQTTSNVENFRSENNTISSTSYQINSTEDIQIPNLDITSLLRKQNTSSAGSANDPMNGVLDKVKEAVQTVNKSYELKLINATSPDVIYVLMYVELLLVTQIMLLLVFCF